MYLKSAQRPDLLEAGVCDVPYHYFTMPRCQICWRLGFVMYLITKVPRGQTCWRLGLADVPYYKSAQRPDLLEAGACDVAYHYFTMPRGQICWRLGLVLYLITKVPRGQTCWRLGLADVPYDKSAQRPDLLEAGV